MWEKRGHLVENGERIQKSEWNWRFRIKFRRLITSSCGDESTLDSSVQFAY